MFMQKESLPWNLKIWLIQRHDKLLFGNYSTIDEGYGQNTTNLLNLNTFEHIRKQDLMDANSLEQKYIKSHYPPNFH